MPWGTQAAHRLLQTIGNCRTLRRIDAFNLTIDDMEAVLAPTQSNQVLQHINIVKPRVTEPTFTADGYVEKACAILGRNLLTSSTLNAICLDDCTLTAAGAYHLVSGLRGNSESALGDLRFHKLEDPEVVKHIAKTVLLAPRLKILRIYGVEVVDDDGVDVLGNALRHSTSFKISELGYVKEGASALLLKALTGEGSNQSITSLYFYGSTEGMGDCLPLLLSSNRALKELGWFGWKEEDLSPNEWRRLGQSYSSSSLEHFRLGVPWSLSRRRSIYGIKEMLSAAVVNEPLLSCTSTPLSMVLGGIVGQLGTMRKKSRYAQSTQRNQVLNCTISPLVQMVQITKWKFGPL